MAPTGGRFREFYYWDTYWIIQGLLLSEMYDTTRGILENFLSMVEQYGFVPNGGRVYYVQRSQPPLLIPMVDSYVTQTSNITFLRNNINLLEAEFQFWMNNRTVTVKKNGREYKLARYYAVTQGPRPESYRYVTIRYMLNCTDRRRVSNYIYMVNL
jgi:alpha,alpha-trehalase